MKALVSEYNDKLSSKSAFEILEFSIRNFRDKIVFATSLGAEDQVLTEMIVQIDPSVKIFTLDTGRLFQETYDLLDITEKKYRIKIEICFPDAARVEKMVREKGINLFYENVENRKLCCHVRKSEPLMKALSGMDAWITGLRREQSVTRQNSETMEWDEIHDLIKINPLISWTHQQVWDYIKERKIPYNVLHDKGFPSIGCLPCTRAVLPGEDIRAGRWWWELPENKECGLHQD